MILQNETVICIKTNEEAWDLFNDNYYIKELPKRIVLPLLEEGLMGHKFDTNVTPTHRKPEFFKDISSWATHMMALGRFVEEHSTTWLLVIESQQDLGFVPTPKKGLTLFGKSYIIDRDTAKKILNNSRIYLVLSATVVLRRRD